MALPLQIRFLMIYHEPKQVSHSKRLKKKGFLSREFSSREYNKKLANEEVLHILCQRCWLLYSKLPIKKNSCHLYKKHFPKIVKTLGTFLPHKIRMMSNCKTYIYIYQTCLSLNYQTYHEIELSL